MPWISSNLLADNIFIKFKPFDGAVHEAKLKQIDFVSRTLQVDMSPLYPLPPNVIQVYISTAISQAFLQNFCKNLRS